MSRLPSLGPRGEGWVVAQLILFVVIAIAGLASLQAHDGADAWGSPAVVGGLILMGGGALLAGRGLWDLRAAITPFPKPVEGAPLIEAGAYRWIRHPIYSGLVLCSVGWGALTGSIVVLGAALLLLLLFGAKSAREEAWLSAAHPGYTDYQRHTKRLIPWIY